MSAAAVPDPAPISRTGIVGGGFMGAGIAESAAIAGIDVTLRDVDDPALTRARERIRTSLAKAVERGKLDDAEPVLDRIDFATGLDGLGEVGVMIEAVPEVAELKRDVFAEISTRVGDDTVLASNTSSIPIAELAGATARPDRVCGLHFFSPVPVMKLVEVVSRRHLGGDRGAGVRARRADGQAAIRTKDRSGFIVNNSDPFRSGCSRRASPAARTSTPGCSSAAASDGAARALRPDRPRRPLRRRHQPLRRVQARRVRAAAASEADARGEPPRPQVRPRLLRVRAGGLSGRAMALTIWHNPRCSKSRQTLELIEAAGIEPEIRRYLDDPPSPDELDAALRALDLEPWALAGWASRSLPSSASPTSPATPRTASGGSRSSAPTRA